MALQLRSLASSSTAARPRAVLRPAAAQRALVRVRAELNTPTPGKALQNLTQAVDNFTKRYDVLSTGVGALTVTSYCVYVKGQDPWTALTITFTATVFALVVNEVFFNNQKH